MPNAFDQQMGRGAGGNIFDSSMAPRTTGQVDLSSSEGLLALAQANGGAVGQAATELMHPETSILSTISSKFKNAFHQFVDVLSTPSQVMAGLISKDYSIREAMDKNITPSDVIFGKRDPNASIYQKTGDFVTRLAVDVLTDPLTYVTFGASGLGTLGLRAAPKITLGANAAKSLGVEELATATLTKQGTDTFQFLKRVENQLKGGTAADIISTGDETLDMGANEVQKLFNTMSKKLDPDFAKRALSNLLENNPGLVDTYLDKGGIKFLGRTLLSAQTITGTARLIPGFTKLDEVTRQPRMAVEALFNPALVKDSTNVWTRLPYEFMEMSQRAKDAVMSRGASAATNLENIVQQFSLSPTEARYLTAAVEHFTLPTDSRLAQAYKAVLGYSDEDWNALVASGMISKEARLERYVPHIGIKQPIGSVSFKTPPSVKTGATQLRQGAKYINEETGEEVVGFADKLGFSPTDDTNIFIDADGKKYKREVAPLHDLGPDPTGMLADIEETLLRDPKAAAKMLDDVRRDGFEIFDDNIVTAWAARSLRNVKATTMQDFVKELAESFGQDAATADARFQGISSKAVKDAEIFTLTKGGQISPQVYHPAIAAHVENFMGSVLNDDATMEFLKAYDKLQNIWKATVTSIWPSFHGRNAISNVLQNFLDIGLHAINPKIHAVSMGLIADNLKANKLQRDMLRAGDVGVKARETFTQLLQKKVFTDVTGHAWSFGELRQVIKNNSIAFTRGARVGASDVRAGHTGLEKAFFPSKHIAAKAVRAAQKPFEIGQDVVGGTIEDHARLVNFVANLRGTGDVSTAAARTRQFLFDYNHLTNFERTFLRRLIPFYTFTRKNLELQVRTLLTAPGRLAAEVHGIQTLGEVISGGQTLSEEERNALPDWVKTGISVLAKKQGDQVTLISNFGTPLEQPFQMIQGNVFLGSISPLVRVPLEQAAGYSFFQGKPLSEVTNAAAFQRAPKVVQDLIGFTELKGKRSDGTPYTWYVSLNPEMMNILLNLPPTTRVLSALKQMDAVDVSEQAKILQQLTGLKPYSFDIQREREKREKERIRELEDLLTKAGVTAQFTRTFIPKEKKNQLSQ